MNDNHSKREPAFSWTWQENKGVKYISIPEWNRQGVRMGFSARQGGCSESPYESLNLGLHVGDDREKVIANRQALVDVFAVSLEQMVCCQQVHGKEVALVDANAAGRGSVIYDTALPGCDAMVCNTPGLLLATFYADCFPVFFFDPVKRAVALAHSGWKGVMGRIVVETLNKMARDFGSKPQDIQVFIGPGIQKCCFEVQPDLANKVRQEFSSMTDIIYNKESEHRWDLPETIRQTLMQAGITEPNLLNCGLCTSCCTDLFYSYRRENAVTGRMAAIIGLK